MKNALKAELLVSLRVYWPYIVVADKLKSHFTDNGCPYNVAAISCVLSCVFIYHHHYYLSIFVDIN